MANIGFIISGNGGNSQYYSPNVKPFVDLSIGLASIEGKAVLFVDQSERHLDEKINSITKDQVRIIYYCPSNMEKIISENSVDFLIVDDNIKLMKHVLRFKKKSYKIAVFVQYLYGVNTNKRDKRRNSLKLRLGSNLPWKFLIWKYKRLIVNFDYIFANSQTCGYILRQFYDVLPSGTVYPPVGVDMRPILDHIVLPTEKNGILIFAGNIVNDHFSRNLTYELNNLKDEIGEPVKLFVSNPETAKTFTREGVIVYSNLKVEELTRLYLESKITYVPTTYELFGYVGAESILCGTRVIVDVYHPFLESVPMETNAAKIAHSNRKISEIFLQSINEKADIETAQKAISNLYSAEASARSLLRALELFN
jgi:hypothetical protein